MKQLLLCRHAKSSWKDLSLDDIDRPLNKRGKKNAPEMGRRLRERDIRPDLIVSSTARRARKTARLIAGVLGYQKKDIVLCPELYEETGGGILRVIRGLDDRADVALLVGHNPEVTTLSNILGGLAIDNIPTCGIVALDFPVKSWSRLGKGEGKLVFFDYPRNTNDGQAT